jgi:hypothetical protein
MCVYSLRVEQLLTTVGSCDSESSDASSETEEDSIDELSGTEGSVVLKFQPISQNDIATRIFPAVSDVTQQHSYTEHSIHSVAESIQVAPYKPIAVMRLN